MSGRVRSLKNLLEDDFELFADYYNVNETGLWEHGKYILYRTTDPEQFANDKKLDLNSFTQKIHHWNEILLKVRSSRISPGLDDNVPHLLELPDDFRTC